MTSPKSSSGCRRIPLVGSFREILVDFPPRARRSASRRLDDCVVHVDPEALGVQARKVWGKVELPPITLHEARHTAASLRIAAGIDPKALQTYMGHWSIATTYDLDGHLLPGSEREHAAMLDAFLQRANTQARLAVLRQPSVYYPV